MNQNKLSALHKMFAANDLQTRVAAASKLQHLNTLAHTHAYAETQPLHTATTATVPTAAATPTASTNAMTASVVTSTAAAPLTKQIVGIPPMFANILAHNGGARARSPVSKPNSQALNLVQVHTGSNEANQAKSLKVPVFAYVPAMQENQPISLLQIAKGSATAAKSRGVQLESETPVMSATTTSATTPWGKPNAFMAALQQQMVSDGDPDI